MILKKWKLTIVLTFISLLLLFNSCTINKKNITESDKSIEENGNIINIAENNDENIP